MTEDDGTVESAIDNANMRLRCISSPMRFIDAHGRVGGYPQVDLVDAGNDDRPVSTIPATMLQALIASEQLTAYVETTTRAVGRSYQVGRTVGRDEVQRELRTLIGVAS